MAQNVKTVLGVPIANVKTFCGVPIANCKTIMGVDNTSGGGGAPAFGASIFNVNEAPGATTTLVIPVTAGTTVPSGVRAVLMVGGWNTSTALSSAVDSQGNTWAVDITANACDGITRAAILSAPITTPLVGNNGDTITLTFTASLAGLSVVGKCVTATGTTSLDVTASSDSVMNFTASATAANAAFALIVMYATTATVSSSGYTQIGTGVSDGNTVEFFFQQDNAASGSTGPNVTSGDAVINGGIMAAYK
jgi:hypothetical protein